MAQDAIDLLDADHQRVETLFRDYLSAGSDAAAKADLAQIICMELTLHAALEEELFYPAFREATKDEKLVQEARDEHDQAKQLIAQAESTDNLDALVAELQRTVQHHVMEERLQIFPKARSAGLDLAALATRLEARKAELVASLQEA
ncbi:hemerythrin domain-containing protein [Ramlibacter tataouinensis]|uniref:Hemerythrin-like domain-containing protein n=1 Tax=Ramlibacter tataouinensis (strain ATCC BAA-407 / DSM 14655 / LMG 21543 / TTB310) TaxID=365046 RepID=F5Y688_RAMTT|nr:hemerythrin domain-containing protein [Ramlibacter tataouinensis]AEG92774.1 conserved hypothetical protein [Ramlibacter tataouinensis TTB310]